MMIGDLFNLLVFNPLYNGLIFLIGHVPYADVGISVFLLTLLVKIIISPLSITALKTQRAVKEIEEPLKAIKEKYKNDNQQQAKEVMALYKEKGINPFSSILLIFIQLPIVLGLYWVFFRGGLPEINTDILYSFVNIPDVINMHFLGLVDMGERSFVLAALAGITQFFHARLSVPKYIRKEPNGVSMKEDLAHSFNIQFRWVLPITIGVISYFLSAALALYWVTSNMVSITEQFYIRRKSAKKEE